MWRDVALIRTLSRYLRQIRVPYSQDYMWATLVKHAAIAGRDRRTVPRPLRSAPEAPRGARRASRQRSPRASRRRCRRSRASTRTASCGTSSTPCSRRSAPISIQLDERRPAEAADRDQVRQRQDHGPAAAAAALRDLRLFAARRGRAHALRQGGARRHPLVGPAAGFPHRGARAGEGAAGQERGDRAGRRQRRLRAQADAEGRHARGDAGRRHRDLQAVHLDAARHHRQSSAPDGKIIPPAERRAPRRRRSLSGGRRRQGHRDLLRHRQRDLRSSTATGWATPSPPAARPATTTR